MLFSVMTKDPSSSLNHTSFSSLCASHNPVFLQSSSIVSLFSECPDLTMSSTVTSDLLNTPDLLEWANQKNFSEVTSYTEADLANRFIIKLKGNGRGESCDLNQLYEE